MLNFCYRQQPGIFGGLPAYHSPCLAHTVVGGMNWVFHIIIIYRRRAVRTKTMTNRHTRGIDYHKLTLAGSASGRLSKKAGDVIGYPAPLVRALAGTGQITVYGGLCLARPQCRGNIQGLRVRYVACAVSRARRQFAWSHR